MAQKEDKTKKAITKVINELWPVNFQLMVVPGGFGKNGIPDHMACVPVIITPDMVGKSYGMFVAVEAKRPKPEGTTKGIQHVRIAEIIAADGFCQITYGPDQAVRLKDSLINRFSLEEK